MNEITEQIRREAAEYAPGDRLTRQEAADYLGVSLSRLAQHRRAGHINHEKNSVTRATRFLYEDVERLRQWRDGEIAELGKVTRR